MAKSMNQDPETAHRIAEACGGIGTGKALHEKCPQGLILSVMGVGRFEEELGVACYLCSFTDKHIATLSHPEALVKAKKTGRARNAAQCEYLWVFLGTSRTCSRWVASA